MKKVRTLVLCRLTETEKSRISRFSDRLEFTFKDIEKVNVTQKDVQEAEIIIGYPPRKYLKEARNLRWLQTLSSGVDRYLSDSILHPEVIVTNARGSYGAAQSEFMFAMLISLMKKLHIYRDNQKQNRWHDEGNVMMLKGSTALVIGLGDIGSRYAKLLKAFGVYVIGVRRDPSKRCEWADEIHSFINLDTLIGKADIISMVVPATPETKNLMNSDRIGLMKKGSVFVNTGRGISVDNEALCDAVESGNIAGAALDVFDVEPLPPGHRIWKNEKILITPHIAGLEYMEDNWKHTLDLIEDNLEAFCEGKAMRNVVDRSLFEFL
ncbi:MAG: D-2-hydroxyacid dehydrogenase [Sphaerochaetaceae bacterium]|nr:D-2-hydroxyacid dehydrogenase [Sphaerochaetaceae bacterium]